MITLRKQSIRYAGVLAVVQVLVAGVPVFGTAAGTIAGAQGSGSSKVAVDSSAYLKAEAMVNNGDATDGRALVDSLLALAKPGTAQYAEGIFWRAKLSSSAEEAQKDYARIIVEYSESPRVPDALLNLGQLEFVRGQRDKAQRHFERLRRDYPGHVLQATASYWVARTLLEGNDLQRGCLMNAEALTQVRPGNIELQNRIKFQNQRCQGVQMAFKDSVLNAGKGAVTDSGAEASDVVDTMLTPVKGKTVPVKGATVAGKAGAASAGAKAGATKTTAGAKAAVVKPATAKPVAAKPVAKPAVKPATEPAESADTVVASTDDSTVATAEADSTVATPAASAKPKTTTAATPASGERYAVQIAAFNTKPQASTLVESLKKKGYMARVDGEKAPYRVKIGRFTSRSGAEALLAELKARKIDGFITKG